MKLALILFGISYAESINHWTGNLFKVDYKQSLKNYKDYIWKYFNKYNIDVFFSTYQSEKSKNLLEDYKPKAYNFFPHLNYIKNFKRIGKNSNVIKGVELALDYSKKRNFKYDVCIVTRFDLLFQIPFEKSKLNLNMFNNTSELERHTRICDNFYVMPGHMLQTFHSIIKSHGIAGNHHYLKYKILKHFKINYIYNEHTHIAALKFYKILRIPTNKKPDHPKDGQKIPNFSENMLIQKNKIKNIPSKVSTKNLEIKKLDVNKKLIVKPKKMLLKNLVKVKKTQIQQIIKIKK